MSYTALARKWRPKKFPDLVGQEHVRRALVNALASGRVHHAFLEPHVVTAAESAPCTCPDFCERDHEND